MKWTKAFDKPLPEIKNIGRLSIKYKGTPHVLVYYHGHWYWEAEEFTDYPLHKESLSEIEWLDESASLPSSSVTGEEDQLMAEEFAEGMMGLGKFDPKKWHHADAMLYNTIVKSVRYGAGEYSKLEQCHDGLKADLERCKRVAGSEITNLRQSLKDIASYNNGFIEYFRRHDYRLMYELWERVYGIATAYPVTGESEAIGFAEWTVRSGYKHSHNDAKEIPVYCHKLDEHKPFDKVNYYYLPELFNLYKQSKK